MRIIDDGGYRAGRHRYVDMAPYSIGEKVRDIS